MRIKVYGHERWESIIKRKLTNYNIVNSDSNDYDIIIPLSPETIIECIEKKLHHKSLICRDANTIELCHDKLKFQTFMESHFPDNIPKTVDENNFPFILKPNKDRWGKNSYIINTPEEYIRLKMKDHIRQEPVKGIFEFASHIIYNNGIKFLKTIQYKCSSNVIIHGQKYKSVERKIINIEDCYIKLFDDILKKLNYRGPCCIDYKITENRAILFEINPRFGNSAMHLMPKQIIESYIKQLK